MADIKEIIINTTEKQLINADLANNFKIIPKEFEENIASFFINEEKNLSLVQEELELIIGKSVHLIPVSTELIEKALSTYYRIGDEHNQQTNSIESNKSSSNDFLEKLIFEAKSIGSSDIHFEVFKEEARIRYRIDGKLIEKYTVKKDNYLELVNKIKIKSNLDITEKRLPQDGRINYDDFDIRVSILPTLHGEKIVMRILGRDTSHLIVDKLGMEEREKSLYLESLKASKGIILISGPTGSGKTTTLYASLKLLNKITNNIVTVEDPIEYTLKGINQVQLREDIGLTFASALKTFLRQDPDIIMLGEIRDAATAEMAIRASLTGHLVLSTIHTNSAMGTISRLIDMGVPSFLIAETLKISVAQRLVRKLCESCKKKSILEKKQYSNASLDKIVNHWISVGCSKCYFTGYKGRTAIYETVPIDSDLAQKIKSNSEKLEEHKEENKYYSSLSEKALQLITDGITSIEEVYSIIIEG